MTEWIVTSSAMILFIIALRGILKGKISLKLQYGLWALVLIRLLLPFSIADSAISVSNILQAPVIREADSAVSDYRENYEAIRQDAVQRGEAMSDDDIRLQVQQELYDRTYSKVEHDLTLSGTPVPETQIRVEAQQQVQVISLTAVIMEALPYFWVAGMIAVAAVLVGSNLHFGWKLRQSRKILDIPGVPLTTYLTDYVATPCLFGLAKPDIYLTNEVMTDSQMRRHVLAHEMSHYRQGDHIWSVLRCVCLVLHWYNPLVWAAAILSKKDAELACDEATIKALGEAERTAYGRTLIGMTCVRRDPGSLMLTATTMLGTKKTLKERIALIAKKPKTALYTLIACILVISLAVGCTFTGAPTETTDPAELSDTDNTVWNQLSDAVDAINSAESRHFSFYMLQEQPGDVDLSGYKPGHECWEYGDDFYLENTEPSQLYYDSTFYARRSDDSWLTDRYPDDDAYGHDVYLPSRNSYTVTWTQNDEYLDVVLQSNDDENDRHLYRISANGKLLWYAEAFQGSITDGDGTQTDTTLYAVCVFHDTAPEDVREKVETAAAEILSAMVEWDGKPNTEPTTEPTELPTEPTVPLTLEEQFQQMLRDDYWYWRIAGCVFDGPTEIDMRLMFYTGMEEHMDWDDLTEAEQQFLLNQPNSSTGGAFFGDPDRLPAEEMNTVLQDYLGITLSDVKIPSSWDYFDQTDAYYRSGTDAYGVGTSVTEVRQDGPFVYVYYTSATPIDDPQGLGSFNDPQMVMTLEEKADGGYYVRSNQVVSASKYPNLSGFSLDQEPYYYPFTAQEIADAKALALDYLDSIVHAPDELRYLKVNRLEFDPALSEAYAARMYGYDGYDPAPAFGGIMLFTVDYEYSRVDAHGNVVLDQDTGYVYCHRASTESAWWVAEFGLTTDTIPQRPTKISSVEDLVTITDSVLTYSGSGGENTVTAHLPKIFPFSQHAIETQLELDRFTIDGNIMSVDTSATLSDGILSVVSKETTYFDVEYYTIYNFNMETGNLMDTQETVSVTLNDVSYVRFLAASHQYALDETRAIFNEREEFYRENGQLEYYQDVLKEMEIDTVRMFANDLCYTEDGLCLYYWSKILSGASNYPTLLPLSEGGPDWDAWTDDAAYDWFFNLEVNDDNREVYYALLMRVFSSDVEHFVQYLNGQVPELIKSVSTMLGQAAAGGHGQQHQVVDALKPLPDSEAKNEILNRIRW